MLDEYTELQLIRAVKVLMMLVNSQKDEDIQNAEKELLDTIMRLQGLKHEAGR